MANITYSVAGYDAATKPFAAEDTITIADASATLQALSAGQFAAMVADNVDIIDATDNKLFLTVAQAQALDGITIAAGDNVVVADSVANIEAMTEADMAVLVTLGVDVINPNGEVDLNLTAAQIAASGLIRFADADNNLLVDTGANIASLSAAQIGVLTTRRVDRIDATDDVLNLTVAQYLALDEVDLNVGDLVTLADTGAALAALTVGQLAGLAAARVDRIDAADDVLSLSTSQLAALSPGVLTAGDMVTITGAGTALAAMTEAALTDNPIDLLDATDNLLEIDIARADFLFANFIALAAGDAVTMTSSQLGLQALSAGQFTDYVGKGVDIFASTSGSAVLSAVQAAAVVDAGAAFRAADLVRVSDTGANIMAALGASFGALEAAGIDRLDATDDVLSLNAAQAASLGAVTLAGPDVVTLRDTGAAIAALSAETLASLDGAGVDILDAADDVLALTVAQYGAADGAPGGLDLTGGDYVTIRDSGANLAAMTAARMGGLIGDGVDALDAVDNLLNLSVAQIGALLNMTTARLGGSPTDAPTTRVALAAGDMITVSGNGAAFASLSATEVERMFTAGVDRFDLTGGVATLALETFTALTAHGQFDIDETITVNGGAGNNLMTGGREKDVFDGKAGRDSLSGGLGADTLTGAAGGDNLTGGGGADVFRFTRTTDSQAGGRDLIMDLTVQDVIDLQLIDADTTVAGNQKFAIVEAFTGEARQLILTYRAASGQTIISADVNGDGVADFAIGVVGDVTDFTNFVL